MAGDMMGIDDWAELSRLVGKMDVIEAGYGLGHETWRIAQVANSVVCIEQAADLPHLGYRSPAEAFAEFLAFRRVLDRVRAIQTPLRGAHQRFTAGEFDVAVIHIQCVAIGSIPEAVGTALFLAPVVVIPQPPHWPVTEQLLTLAGPELEVRDTPGMFVISRKDAAEAAAAEGE